MAAIWWRVSEHPTPSDVGENRLGPAAQSRLSVFLAGNLPGYTSSAPLSLTRLPGGAVQESWRVAAPNVQPLVLRTDGRTKLSASHSRRHEFALLAAARAAGVRCPTPLHLEPTGAVIGRPFFLMSWEEGSADPVAVTSLDRAAGTTLGRSLARELAALHRLRPGQPDLDFLPPVASATRAALSLYRQWLDDVAAPQPLLEWAMRRLGRTVPADVPPVLCHRDFRTGNYLVAGGRLSAVLDWEFAGWSDPREDLGWFCSRSWRFVRPDRAAGGIASRADFIAAYEEAGDQRVDPEALRWWEAMASLRWALVAWQQLNRMLVGGERSLDLALTGRRPAECEAELLRLLGNRRADD